MPWYWWVVSYIITVIMAIGIILGLEQEDLVKPGDDIESVIGAAIIWPVVLAGATYWTTRRAFRFITRRAGVEIPKAKVVGK